MSISLRNILILFVVAFLIMVGKKETSAQKVDAFARVSVSPREGVVRQPYKVNISVYSSTWFAKPLQFTNLRIDNAFIIPFTRTVSGINYINNKKYATLTFYYLVFPYNTGTLEIPELVINASIPPEGDYKGKATVIRTKPQNIKVKAVPSSKDEPVWMVAKNISVKETWNRSLNDLKVGDVVEREIIISAEGTLPSLIAPLKIEEPELGSIYPQQADLEDKRNNQDANGVRTERYSYLFEKEGEVIIPDEEILWWNPQSNRVFKRTLSGRTINIAANPDLEMMASLKDSLLAMSAPLEVEAEEKTIPWVKLAIVLVLLVFVLYYGIKIVRQFFHSFKIKRSQYLQSEAYCFKQLLKTLERKHRDDFIPQLYVWFDKARKPEQPAAIYDYLDEDEQKILASIISSEETTFSTTVVKQLKDLLSSVRKKLIDVQKHKSLKAKLNPV